MKNFCLVCATLALTFNPTVGQSQDQEPPDRRIPKADTAVVKAIDDFAKSIGDGDEEFETRLKLDAIRMIQASRAEKQNYNEAQKLRTKRAENPKETEGQAKSLDSTRIAPTPDYLVGVKRAATLAPNTASLERFAAQGFAPREMARNSIPTMQGNRLFGNPVWQENMSRLIATQGITVAPRIYNPNDDEGNPTKDVLDCVSIGVPGRSCCTGTLIAPNAVLTAAHCVRTPGEPGCGATHIYIGWNSNNPAQGDLFLIKKEIPHPNYNASRFYNDIAILILDRPVPSTKAIPRPLAFKSEVESAKSFLAMGFGFTEHRAFGIKYESPVALAALHANEVEAGGNGFDSCQGDSGGPLFYVGKFGDNKGKLYLAGVTSHGGECGQGGVYTRVDVHKNWIDRELRNYGSATR